MIFFVFLTKNNITNVQRNYSKLDLFKRLGPGEEEGKEDSVDTDTNHGWATKTSHLLGKVAIDATQDVISQSIKFRTGEGEEGKGTVERVSDKVISAGRRVVVLGDKISQSKECESVQKSGLDVGTVIFTTEETTGLAVKLRKRENKEKG